VESHTQKTNQRSEIPFESALLLICCKMFQVAPIVDGQTTSVDIFGFYVSLLQSGQLETDSNSNGGGGVSSSPHANPQAAGSDAASDATGVSSVSKNLVGGSGAAAASTGGSQHPYHHNPPTKSMRHAPKMWSDAEIEALEREESFWMSHIVQFMYLQQKRQHQTENAQRAQKLATSQQQPPQIIRDDEAGSRDGGGARSPTTEMSSPLLLERELSFQGGADDPTADDPNNDDPLKSRNMETTTTRGPQDDDQKVRRDVLDDLSGGRAADDDDVASLHRFHDPIVSSDGDADALLAVSHRVAAAMRRHVALQGGVPFVTLRRIVWGFFSGAMQRPPGLVTQHHALYQQLVATPIDPEIADVIQRDLGRTLPTHCLFRDTASVGQVQLRRVLCAYAALDPAVGYCQGMGFIVSMLLVHMPEEEAFWTFVHMMQGSQFAMRQLYLPGFPLLQQFFIILRRLLRTFLPTLYRHFEDEGLDVAFFAAQWYMTLFVYQLPFGVAARIWDLFLSRGWVAIFQAALALLQWDSELLLTMSMEDSLLYLKEFHEGKHEEELIRRLLDVPLHEDDLRSAMLDA
jgi:hypothetical protein